MVAYFNRLIYVYNCQQHKNNISVSKGEREMSSRGLAKGYYLYVYSLIEHAKDFFFFLNVHAE